MTIDQATNHINPASGALETTLRADLAAAVASVNALERDYADVVADPGAIQEDRDATGRSLAEARRATAIAQGALSRFTDGSYGRCSVCGRAVDPERLEAMPDATTCISCMK